ncbi:MAG: hypothetical protein WBA39_03865 [Rivularia sp. (in: cyanobacteria)]
MSEDTAKNQAEKNNPKEEAPELSPEMLDKIKHPPSINNTLQNQSPEELKGNPAVSPEMLDDR